MKKSINGVSLSSGCNNLKSEIKALGLRGHQVTYVNEMTRRIIDESHLFFDPGKVNPDFLQFTSNHLGVWGNYAKYHLMTPQEQAKYPHEFTKACDEIKDTLEFLSESGDMIVTRFKDNYFDKDGDILFPAGTIVATVKRSIFPNLPDMDEGCMELLDPDKYDYSHAVLDFVNKKLKGEFPHRNLWTVALDFDYLGVYDLDKLPHIKRY